MDTDPKTTEEAGRGPEEGTHVVVPSREDLLRKIIQEDKRWRYLHSELEIAKAKTEAKRAEYLAEAMRLWEEAEGHKKEMADIRDEVKRLSGKLAGISNAFIRKKTSYHCHRKLSQIHVSSHEKCVSRQITKHNQALHSLAEEAWIRATKQAYWSQRVATGVMPNLPPPKGQIRKDEAYEKMISDAANALAGRKPNEPKKGNPQAAAEAGPGVARESEGQVEVNEVQNPGGCSPGGAPVGSAGD